MSSSFRLAPRQLALLALLLALPGGYAPRMLAEAQEQSGRNLLLGADRSRALGEPERVLGIGGPSVEELKRHLEQRIQAQSEGQITLFGLRQISTLWLVVVLVPWFPIVCNCR